MFGIQMTRNFAYPYFSQSIPEFWRRWHITLSTWFREYLYIPLGGNRVGPRRRALNVMIVFLVSGFWHGANWTFIAWGFLHGLYFLAYERFAPGIAASRERTPGGAGLIPSLKSLASMILVFHLTCIAWVFFRASNIREAVGILRSIIRALISGPAQIDANHGAMVWIIFLLAIEWAGRRGSHPLQFRADAPRPVRWLVYYALVAAVLLFAPLDYSPFIYFQF